jgi:hypothetical protein
MYTYALLEPDCYYIIQEKENDALVLLQVKVITDGLMYVVKYKDEMTSEWKKKSDTIHDILELLDDEAVKKWSEVYFSSDASYHEEDDE